MDSVDIEVLRSAEAWRKAGHRVTFGTIVKTWGSAPRPVGALVAVRDDGQVVGSLSGGCVEDDLIEKVRAKSVAVKKPETLVYGITKEQADRFKLPCGGTLELVLEPVGQDSGLAGLLASIERHELIARVLDMETGRVRLEPGRWSETVAFDGKVLRTVHGPRWRLLIIGAGQLSRYLATMAQALDYHLVVCDPREEYEAGWDMPGVPVNRGMPDDVVLEMNMDAHCAVVALTHDPKLDDLALLEALKSPAFYVGALGSKKNNDTRRKRLAEFDLSAAEIARLRGPVGLKIGSKTPPEIAVAILAEMTAMRNGVQVPELIEPAKAGIAAGCTIAQS
jgi:xanthine dehydrogenase accessory factor